MNPSWGVANPNVWLLHAYLEVIVEESCQPYCYDPDDYVHNVPDKKPSACASPCYHLDTGGFRYGSTMGIVSKVAANPCMMAAQMNLLDHLLTCKLCSSLACICFSHLRARNAHTIDKIRSVQLHAFANS